MGRKLPSTFPKMMVSKGGNPALEAKSLCVLSSDKAKGPGAPDGGGGRSGSRTATNEAASMPSGLTIANCNSHGTCEANEFLATGVGWIGSFHPDRSLRNMVCLTASGSEISISCAGGAKLRSSNVTSISSEWLSPSASEYNF